jgi:hypothetical protein
VKPEIVEYGYRSRLTGKYVRLDEELLDDGYDNATLQRRLTFDEGYPILQEADLRAIVAFRYGKVILNTLGHDFAPADFDVDDLEPVEFSTTEIVSRDGATSRFVTEVRAMHFDIIRDVEIEDVPRKGEGSIRLRNVFDESEIASMLETIGRPDTTWLGLVVLKGALLDHDPEELVGKVVVCDPTIRPLKKSGAYGILGARAIDGTTYAVTVYGCHYPCFYATPPEPGESAVPAWDDLKVSFGFDGSDEEAADLLREIWEGQHEDEGLWPEGWDFHEISGNGCEMTVVFSVAGPLINEDAALVRAALSDVEAGHDIRSDLGKFSRP